MMKVYELIALLQQQDPESSVQEAFSEPALIAAREHVASTEIRRSDDTARKQRTGRELRPALRVARVDTKILDEVLRLSKEWADDPKAFFRPWRLDSDAAQADSQTTGEDTHRVGPVPTTTVLEEKCDTQHMRLLLWRNIQQMRDLGAQRQGAAMRQILSAVLFYDIVMEESPRRQKNSGLPTGGMSGLVSRAWKRMTEEELDTATAQEVVGYVKVGYRCDLVGEAVGQGSWLLLPEQVLRIGKHYKVQDIQQAPDLFAEVREFVQNRLIANTAARYIRAVQFRPFTRSSGKRRQAGALPSERPLKQLMPSDSRTSGRVSSGFVPSPSLRSDRLVPLTVQSCAANQHERTGSQIQAFSHRQNAVVGGCDQECVALGSCRHSADTRLPSDSDCDTTERRSLHATAEAIDDVVHHRPDCTEKAAGQTADVFGGLSPVVISQPAPFLGECAYALSASASVNRCSIIEKAVICATDCASEYRNSQTAATSLSLVPSLPPDFLQAPHRQAPGSLALFPNQRPCSSPPVTYARKLAPGFQLEDFAAFGLTLAS